MNMTNILGLQAMELEDGPDTNGVAGVSSASSGCSSVSVIGC